MKWGRFHIEYWPRCGWFYFHKVKLYCGCFRFLAGPFTFEYVTSYSWCWPKKTCSHGRNVKFSCGHEFWSGWGIPYPEPGDKCPNCKYGIGDL